MIQGRQISLAIQALFVVASALAKISIIVSYFRLALVNSWFRKLCHASIWLIILSNGSLFVVLWTQCKPLSDYWNVFKRPNNCLPEAPPLLFQSIMNVVTDFIVWALPLYTLYRARLPLAQRIALIILFSFGLFVCVAGCVRTYWIYYIIEETFDPTWQGFHLWIWTAVEVHLGVICGCVPWLKSLIKYKKGTDVNEPSHGYMRSGATATIGGSGAMRSGMRKGTRQSGTLVNSHATLGGGGGGGGGGSSGAGNSKRTATPMHDGLDSKWLGDTSSLEGEEMIDMDSYSGGNKSQRTSSTHPIIVPHVTLSHEK